MTFVPAVRRALFLGLLVLTSPAWGQGLKEEPHLKLDLSVEQAKLIAQVLGQVACGNVQQLMICNQAAELVGIIKKQAQEQVK